MIESTVRSVTHTGDGVLAAFAYTFKVFDQAHLKVTQIDATTGVGTVLTLTTNYTVTGVGVAAGGIVTLVAGAMPLNDTLKIERVMPLTQLVDLKNQTTLRQEDMENALDRMTMMLQEMQMSASVATVDVYTTATKPAASAAWHRKWIAVEDAGQAEMRQYCVRDATGNYHWVTDASGPWT